MAVAAAQIGGMVLRRKIQEQRYETNIPESQFLRTCLYSLCHDVGVSLRIRAVRSATGRGEIGSACYRRLFLRAPGRFDTPQQAADALVNAAEKFDVVALTEIFGPDGNDIVLSGEFAQDRKHAADFAAQARKKKSVSVDPKIGNRAFLLVGDEDWPFPVPLVKSGGKWFFDSKAGRQELLYRRIGANELDAIEVCRGYVEAQDEYALQPARGLRRKSVCPAHRQHSRQAGWLGLARTPMALGVVRWARTLLERLNRATPAARTLTMDISSKS